MQAAPTTAIAQTTATRPVATGSAPIAANTYAGYQIIRRNGAVVAFEPNKIAVALMKAFLAVHGTQGAASASVRETVERLTESVVRALLRSRPGGGTFHIEDVQDHVELGLMRSGHHEVARAYVLYRERRAQERARQGAPAVVKAPELFATENGQRVPLDFAHLQTVIESACAGLGRARARRGQRIGGGRGDCLHVVPCRHSDSVGIRLMRSWAGSEGGAAKAAADLGKPGS